MSLEVVLVMASEEVEGIEEGSDNTELASFWCVGH